MRLNTRNIILLGVGLIIIIGFFVYQQVGTDDENTTDATPENDTSGVLFADVDQDSINRFEIRELEQPVDEDTEPTEEPEGEDAPPVEEPEPAFVIMSKDAESFWSIDEATNATVRGTDQATVVGSMINFATLAYSESFSLESGGGDLEPFGLVNPTYEILIANDDNEYRLMVGNENPTGTRYYALANDDSETIYLVNRGIINGLTGYLAAPPYVPAPTDTPTPFPTANPFSEVEQTATAEAIILATLTTATPLPEVGLDPAEVTPLDVESANDAEVTEEVTEETTESDS